MSNLIADDLRSLLNYDEDTGTFTWRVRRGGKAAAGSVAGVRDDRGYLKIRIRGTTYYAHRLAWLYIYGNWPDAAIDHIDGDGTNNSRNNLRDVSLRENQQNQTRHRAGAYPGVKFRKDRNRWEAEIRVGGKRKYLGYYKSPEDARAAYIAACSSM